MIDRIKISVGQNAIITFIFLITINSFTPLATSRKIDVNGSPSLF